MKNIYLIVCALTISAITSAQNTCTNALPVNPGMHTISDIVSGQIPNPECAENYGFLRTGGRWFIYTATADGVAKVTSDIASNSNLDTRLHIYAGDCSSLICVGGNDDKDAYGNNRSSESIWPVENGVSYYIAWDNQYSTDGFDFELSETAVACSTELPLSADFDDMNTFIACYFMEDADANGEDWKLQILDLDGDGSDEDYTTNGTNSTNAKNDWLFSPPIDLITSNSYRVNFKYNGGNGTFPANENLDVKLVDAPSSTANVLHTLFTDTGITRTGNFSQAEELATVQSIPYVSTNTGTYYLAFNASSPANSGSLLLFDYSVVNETLSVPEVAIETFHQYYNSHTDVLNVKSFEGPLTKFVLFNILGVQVMDSNLSSNEENINLSALVDGIYIARIVSGSNSKTFKLLKQ